MTLAEFHAYCAGYAQSKGAKDDEPTEADYDAHFAAQHYFETIEAGK